MNPPAVPRAAAPRPHHRPPNNLPIRLTSHSAAGRLCGRFGHAPRSGPSQEPHAHHSASIPPTPPRRSPPMGRRALKTHSAAPNNLPVRVRVITGRR